MWTFSILGPRFADEKLASLSVESPTNLRTDEEFGLLVALWCGRIRDHIETENGAQEFCFGFRVGEIAIDLTGGRISNQGRFSLAGSQVKIAQSETDAAKKDGSAGAQLGINVGKWLSGLGKAEADLGGSVNRAISNTEQKERTYSQTSWRIADAGHNFWRVSGFGLNSDNVLENRLLGDEPLCHVIAERGATHIEVLVSFRCDLRDVWFKNEGSLKSQRDARFSEGDAERNRIAIASRICAIALGRTMSNGARKMDGTVILAEQGLLGIRQTDGN
jgi:hypothetical protein